MQKIRKQKEFEKFQELYKEGLDDQDISNAILVNSETIRNWRKKLNLTSNFNYFKFESTKKYKIIELVKLGLSDLKIAEKLNVSVNTVYSIRRKNKIERRPLNVNEPIIFTQIQKEVLFGCLLGDGSLRFDAGLNPRFKCSHSLEQKKYNTYKYKFFEKYSKLIEYTRPSPDKRNGICYSESTFTIGANVAFKEFYEMFYKKVKEIPIEHLNEYYSPLAMAIHFMDDGTKETCGYSIATMCFKRNNVKKYCDFLLDKYGIITTIRKSNGVYISAKSREKFTDLISPYMCESMRYKLHNK